MAKETKTAQAALAAKKPPSGGRLPDWRDGKLQGEVWVEDAYFYPPLVAASD